MKNTAKRVFKHFQRNSTGASVGVGTLLQPGFSLDIRSGRADQRVVVGSNSVLQCRITLERETGKVAIGNDTFIGASHLICAQEIVIGSNVLIAWGCTIVDHNSHSVLWSERGDDVRRWREGLLAGAGAAASIKNWQVVPMDRIQIGDKAWIGFNSIVLKGVFIGEGAVIGAGSVVTKDIPAWTIAAGNPASIIREIAENER